MLSEDFRSLCLSFIREERSTQYKFYDTSTDVGSFQLPNCFPISEREREEFYYFKYIFAKSWGFPNPDIKLNFLENEIRLQRVVRCAVFSCHLLPSTSSKVYRNIFWYCEHVFFRNYGNWLKRIAPKRSRDAVWKLIPLVFGEAWGILHHRFLFLIDNP